jgi:glycerol-3-phosphate acyltransferase PlsY
VDLLNALPGLLLGYVLGSIPFGLLLTKAAGIGDIRNIGSQNIGATNVLRTGRKDLAAGTLVLDALKGTVAILIAAHFLNDDARLAAAFGAFIGHLFPVWLKFKGGKGVATYLGCLLGLWWPSAFVFAIFWLGSAKLFRYSSASALIAAAVTPLAFFMTQQFSEGVLVAILSILIFISHRANILRLLSGTESKIGQRS